MLRRIFAGARRSPRVALEGLLVGLSQFVIIAAYAVGFRVITEWYPPAVLGEANLFTGALTLAAAIVFQPVFSAHVRLFPEYRERGQLLWFHRRILVYLSWLAAGVSGLAAIAMGVHYALTGVNRMPPVLILAVALLGQMLFTFQTDIMSAARRQSLLAGFRILRSVAYPLVVVTLAAWISPDVLVFLLGTALSFWLPALTAHFLGWARIREASTQSKGSEQVLRTELVSYGTPLAFLGAANWLSAIGDRYVLAYYLTPGDVGVYSAVYGLFSQPYLALAGGLVIWLRPMLFDAAARDRPGSTRRILGLWTVGGGALAASGGVFLWFTREYWLRIFLAEPYRQDGQFLGYILVGYSCHVVSNAITYRLMMAKKTVGQFVSVVAGAVTNIGLNVLLVPRLGLDGAGLATAVSFFLQAVLLGVFVWHLEKHEQG
jgi:O-antigen/teichoic acid export membrane protein